MTEMDRMRIVENMFPDWKEHLSDGKIIDHILEGLACRKSCSTDARDEVVITSHAVAEKGAKDARQDAASTCAPTDAERR